MPRILIIGATSAIARETGKIYAARGYDLHLLARDDERLQKIADDYRTRGAASVEYEQLDINNFKPAFKKAFQTMGQVDIALLAHGILPDQDQCNNDLDTAKEAFDINGTSTMLMLLWLSGIMEKQGSGTLAAITSVAGDRGRSTNYIYGAAKSAVSTLLQGLRSRLDGTGVRVLTIKPGFVDTPMTAAFDKGFLWASPQTVAHGITKGIDNERDVVYLPGFWKYIMFIIRIIPERIFKKMSF